MDRVASALLHATRRRHPRLAASAAWQRCICASSSTASEAGHNYNPDPFGHLPLDPASAHFPLHTARTLSRRREPPRRVRMLARDFVHDSLYNPHYGYFATQVEIFDPSSRAGDGIPFRQLKNVRAFEREVEERYGQDEKCGVARQVWHTPTELFKPWYARAIANQIATTFPTDTPLRIYEIGAGTGSLMCEILSYLRTEHPKLYKNVKYTTIEISARLATLQRSASEQNGHASKVNVTSKSVLDLSKTNGDGTDEICVVLATEVLDNLPRDLIRWTTRDSNPIVPLQAMVTVDERGGFTETYQPVTDLLLARFLETRSSLTTAGSLNFSLPLPISKLEASSPWWRSFKGSLPFMGNLSEPEWVPTGMFKLLEVIKQVFPNHRLLMSDFDSLPDTISGYGAPVVQTRYEGTTVPCTTYLVSQGFFDIFFPTDFYLLAALHSHLNPTTTAPLSLLTHSAFLTKYAMIEATKCQDGSNPMLQYYENVAFAFTP